MRLAANAEKHAIGRKGKFFAVIDKERITHLLEQFKCLKESLETVLVLSVFDDSVFAN